MTTYQRIFGSGPRLLLLAFFSLIAAVKWQSLTDWPGLQWSPSVRLILAGAVLIAGGGLIIWAFYTLPLNMRGRHLVTSGPYRYVRHPLYTAVFLSSGLAVLFITQAYFVVVAIILMFIAGHLFIGDEERLMEQQFGQAWRDYARRTPRFFPRWP